MARWYRSGRYYGRNRGYYRRTYYNRSNTRTKSWGNMKAAKQQADQSTFTINIPSTCAAFLHSDYLSAAGGGEGYVIEKGVYAMNIYDQLRKSDFFKSYANMYDEFKIDRIKVKLLPTSFTYTANSNGGRYSNITVYTAWDRTGLSKDQVKLFTKNVTATTPLIGTKTEGNIDGLYVTVGKDITTYSSAESRVVNPGTNTSIVRWLNPKTIQEKGQWISTSQLKSWYSEYQAIEDTTLLGRYIGIPTGIPYDESTGTYVAPGTISKGVTYDGDIEIDTQNTRTADAITQIDQVESSVMFNKLGSVNSENPCYLVEDSAIKFKPTLLVGIYPESNTNICQFNVETEVVCTFRGLRKATVVAA